MRKSYLFSTIALIVGLNIFNCNSAETPIPVPEIPTDSSGITDMSNGASITDISDNIGNLSTSIKGGTDASTGIFSSSSQTINTDNIHARDTTSSSSITDALFPSHKKFTLLDLTEKSFSLGCVDHEILGVCLWMTVSGFPPSIYFNKSFITSNYNADAIVEVFKNEGDLPTDFSKLNNEVSNKLGDKLYRLASKILFGISFGLGNGDENEIGGFHSVHVMGNPLITAENKIIGTLHALDGFCPSDVTPFLTYYHSDLDPEWRVGLYEMLRGANPILAASDARDGSHDWGNIYPRTGWTENDSNTINASTVAARAMNIATDSRGDHVVHKMPFSSSGYHLFTHKKDSKGIVDFDHGKWQLLSPKGFKTKCRKIPFTDVDNILGTEEMNAASRKYVFQVWRKYRCCKVAGEKLITFFGAY